MSMATTLQSTAKHVPEPRPILGPTGNRVRVSEESKKKPNVTKKPQRPRKMVPEVPVSTVRNALSVESCVSSDSSATSSGSSVKTASAVSTVAKPNGAMKSVKIVSKGGDTVEVPTNILMGVKRCDWITVNSDPLYISFHDEEWGVGVYDDDKKLFELLVFSQALAELSWSSILNKRDIFRKLFDNFDPSSVAQSTEKKLLSFKVNGSLVLSEQKLRAIAENAKQILKVQEEFGSFSNYCWRFINHKPIRNRFPYTRQVPAKSPKAEHISKDMMQRGFRCVGPTVVYSFMQVSGMVNDHLLTCFRYHECYPNVEKDPKTLKINEIEMRSKEDFE